MVLSKQELRNLIISAWDGIEPPPGSELFNWPSITTENLDADDQERFRLLGDQRFDQIDCAFMNSGAVDWMINLSEKAVGYYTGSLLLCQLDYLINQEKGSGPVRLYQLSNLLMGVNMSNSLTTIYNSDQIKAMKEFYRYLFAHEPDYVAYFQEDNESAFNILSSFFA